MQRFISRVAWFILAVAVAAAVGAPAAEAQTKSLFWERFDVDLTVQSNGDLRVVETQVINFTSGTFREGFAELVTRNTDGISDVTVSEGGQPYARAITDCCLGVGEYYVKELDSGNLEVVWNMGPTRNTQRAFVLAYTVHGAIRRYEQGNEFQWNAISPGLHDFEINAATVTLHMPEGAPATYANYLDDDDFNGVTMAVTQSADGRTVTWMAQESLLPWEGVQVVVQFPPNTVGGSKPRWQAAYDFRVNWENTAKPLADLGVGVLALLLLTGGPVGLYLLWHLWGRDPEPGAVPEFLTSPPGDIPPGIAGTLVDERADTADIIATLVDLARRGYLEIEETELPKRRGLGKDFAFRKLKRGKQLRDLQDYEQALLEAVFGNKDEVKLKDLNQKFYVHLPKLRTKLYDGAVKQGYFGSNPDAVRGRWGGLGTALLIIAGIGGFMLPSLLQEWVSTIVCPFMALGAVGIGLKWLSRHMPVKSRQGAEAAALSRAFKEYLANLERYAEAAQIAEQFEKFLPYAIAFGLERKWIHRFKTVPDMPVPIWYHPYRPVVVGRGGTGHTAAEQAPSAPSLQSLSDGVSGGLQSMSDGLNTMLNSAARSLTSTPPSSSSGSGGRSFSGGGFSSFGGSGGGGRGFR